MKILSILLFLAVSAFGHSQEKYSIPSWEDWTDKEILSKIPQPIVTGYGNLSDSLFTKYGIPFYESSGEYFAIGSLADYYYWFIKRYNNLFIKPIEVYEYYYATSDSLNMAIFVQENYKGKHYPIPFKRVAEKLIERESASFVHEKRQDVNKEIYIHRDHPIYSTVGRSTGSSKPPSPKTSTPKKVGN
ncbi:hypothetical protein [Ekhidna lutea]|nr:hypothetical protein [Ekhidna lutea]